MGSSILRGITMALLVTVLTLIAGIVWSVMELGVLSFSQLLDFGLMASCLVGGYRTAKVSGEWLLGGIVGAGYVTVGTLLLALFLPIRGWGFIQVLAEGAFIGLVGGAVGAGGTKGRRKSAWSGGKSIWSGNRTQVTPSYAGYEINDSVNTKFDWEKEEKSEENM
ncbi:MAG: TIGR04086 family membrane protein, partial [Desulfosporosinus sp.]